MFMSTNVKFSVSNMNLYYGDFHALKNVNLDMNKNEITAFIGPSGCGKSTLLKSLNRMNDLVEGCKITGDIRLDGVNIYKEIVETSLKQASIWNEVKDRLKKSALGMSGGQQQRLCIARALAVKPQVILMDEPTSALDPISTMKIEELCEELKPNYTIIMVTHNMQQATRISDKTAFFLHGEVVEYGNTQELFSMPKDKRTEDYITGRFG